jgi:hypothetical protein
MLGSDGLEDAMERVSRRSRLVIGPVFCTGLAILLSAEPARAQLWHTAWSAPGSTGVVDESNTSIVTFDSIAAALRATASAGSVAVIRYPVTSLPSAVYVPGLGAYVPLVHLRLTMAFQKPDEGSYAAATLKRVRLSDGVASLVASVNSVAHVPAGGTQLEERAIVCATACFQPFEYAYYVEVVLWKPDITNNPKVVSLWVSVY